MQSQQESSATDILIRREIKRTALRALINDKLRILEFDENHEIVTQLTLVNALSRYQLAKNDNGIDGRLLDIGWYYEKFPVFDTAEFNVGESIKWGLKNNLNSILIKPKYPEPIFIPQTNFSLIKSGVADLEWNRLELKKMGIYLPIDINTGKFIVPFRVLSVDSSDSYTKSYTKVVTEYGVGFINSDNKFCEVRHFDLEDEQFLRIARAKNPSFDLVDDNHIEGVQIPGYNLS